MISISASERKFTLEGIKCNVRTDGRERLDYRQFSVSCGVLPQANGSARVRLAHGNTEVIASVKAELITPAADKPEHGTIECSVECWTSASVHYAGKAAADMNSELTAALTRSLINSKAFDTKSLCICKGKFAWALYVDALVLDSGGSLTDAINLAATAALSDTRLPTLRLVHGEREDDVDVEVDENPLSSQRLTVSDLPVTITWHVISGVIVADARLEEELCAEGRIIVSLNRKGNILGTALDGPTAIAPGLLHAAMDGSSTIAPKFFFLIDDAVVHSEDAGLDLFADLALDS